MVTTCTMNGSTGYSLVLSAADLGPGGQTFTLSAQRPLPVALMQVLGGVPSLIVLATAAAVANDQSLSPALAALRSTACSCPGSWGRHIGALYREQTNTAAIFGDVVSNGALENGRPPPISALPVMR